MTGHDAVDVMIGETIVMTEMTTMTDETGTMTTDADTNRRTATDTTAKRTMTVTKTGIPTEIRDKRMAQKKKTETTRVGMTIKIAAQAAVDEEAIETETETAGETGTAIGDAEEVETDTMTGTDIDQIITTGS